MVESNLQKPSNSIEIIAVASGKGGVGKSTVSANLARAFTLRGKKVGVIDADIYGFSIPRLLDVSGQPKGENDTIHPLEAHDMQIMSMGFFANDNEPIIWRGPMLMKAMDQLLNDVSWDSSLDYLVIDLPPGTGDVALSVAQQLPSSHVLLITMPDQSSVKVASRAGHMARQTDLSIAGVVENMSCMVCRECGKRNYPFGKGGGKILAEEMDSPLLAEIPLESGLGSERRGAGLLVDKADSQVGEAIRQLAEDIDGNLSEST